ncbi:hypothetical protein DL98DRAFT_514398 [Cadophora sp. DSE1049]|nr:hypothetical protein DL98DRAFT_514398 [Cadophora sp. DSE1049]
MTPRCRLGSWFSLPRRRNHVLSAHGSGGATNKHVDIAPSTWFLVHFLLLIELGIQSQRLSTPKHHDIDVNRRFMLKTVGL